MYAFEICELLRLDGLSFKTKGPGDAQFAGLSGIYDYKRGTASWIGGEETGEELLSILGFPAALLVTPFELPDKVAVFQIITDEPQRLFFRLASKLLPAKRPSGIASSARVSPSSAVGRGTYIGHNCLVEEEVVIGESCSISCGVIIRSGVRLGRGCIVGAFAVLGDKPSVCAEDAGDGAIKWASLKIGEKTVIGAHTVIESGLSSDTGLGLGCRVGSCCHIGSGCTVGDGTVISAGTVILENVIIGCACDISTSIIREGVRIGGKATIGFGAAVSVDVPPEGIVLREGN